MADDDAAKPPESLRAIAIVVRSLHVVAMALVLGGVAAGASDAALRTALLLTLTTGVALAAVELGRRCLVLGDGSGVALFVKLALVGLAYGFGAARLELLIAATLVASVGSHMPSSWRHFVLRRRRARGD